MLNIRFAVCAYQITRQLPSAREYLQEEFMPLEYSSAEELLEPIKFTPRNIELSGLKLAELFGRKTTLKPAQEGQGIVPLPNEEENVELHLKGIAQEAGKKVALINDQIVKEAEDIAGWKVKEINRFNVVLSRDKKELILELGK